MRKFVANYFADGTRRAGAGHHYSSGRVCHDGGGAVLSHDRATRGRDLLPPATASDARQRSALAHLVSTIAPTRADKIAAKLLKEFGSLGRIFAETKEAQFRVLGDDPAVLSLLGAARGAMEECLKADIDAVEVDPDDPRLIRYLLLTMGSLRVETLRILFLDNARRLLSEEEFASGSISKLTIYPRAIFKRALEKNASKIVLVHNHPAGSCAPSIEDVSITQMLVALGHPLDIEILDHIIVAGSAWLSMRSAGYLE